MKTSEGCNTRAMNIVIPSLFSVRSHPRESLPAGCGIHKDGQVLLCQFNEVLGSPLCINQILMCDVRFKTADVAPVSGKVRRFPVG